MTKFKMGIKSMLLVVLSLFTTFIVGWFSGVICDQYARWYVEEKKRHESAN